MAAELSVMWVGAREAVVRISDGGLFQTKHQWSVFVNGSPRGVTDRVLTYVDGLEPDSVVDLHMRCEDTGAEYSERIATRSESYLLNVRDFGAKGDGFSDDTPFIQAAISCCPEDGRVVVPKGMYRVSALFLQSRMTLQLCEGACLMMRHDRQNMAYMPGYVTSSRNGEADNDGASLPLGTWEGEPARTFCSLLTAIRRHDVVVCGRGSLDGCATFDDDNWWHDAKRIVTACRPRLVFFSECSNVVLAGITLRNSPSWNVHPVLCDGVSMFCTTIQSPEVSPNTDGFNPESCNNVHVAGCLFSVGDDCIAIKSGKLGMPRVLRPACSNIVVEQCRMQDGHGAVVLGSETAGGVRNLSVRDCIFDHTDRGLRIKTRRGRGKDATIENVSFTRIRMDNVLTPFVVNSFYFCDADGKSDYVQSRESLPVDERTPHISVLVFKDIQATNAQAAAAWVTGLPESKIDLLDFENVRISFAPNPAPSVPAMASGVSECCGEGIVAQYVKRLVLNDVVIDGCSGPDVVPTEVGSIERQ